MYVTFLFRRPVRSDVEGGKPEANTLQTQNTPFHVSLHCCNSSTTTQKRQPTTPASGSFATDTEKNRKMTDNWDDSDDEWDVDDDALDAKLGLKKDEPANDFDDEEDLAVEEKAAADKLSQVELKKKGSALAAKKEADKARQEELEIARKAMELEAEMEENMTPDERRALERKRIEEADNALTDDLFGGVEALSVSKKAQQAGDKVVMKDMKDHMRHARKVAECLKGHGKIHLACLFLKEVIQESKDVLDDNAISDIIKTCNVIKNEKVQESKRKVKGQAQKSKKADKKEQAKVKKQHDEVFGDNDNYDDYDQMGGDYEDAFF